jgi:long-chain fatty acid transport protein
MKLKNISRTGFLFATLALSASQLFAAGFYLTEVGTPGSVGTAGTANPTNTFGADSSWTNPAGMTGLQSDRIFSGLTVIAPKMNFDPSSATTGTGSDGGNAGIVAGIPSFFYVKKIDERSRFGFSVVAPLGGGVDYGDSFVGRYQTISAELAGVGFSPSYGYQVNDKLSLGAGLSIIYTRFDQEIAINNPGPGVADGNFKIDKADGWGYQPFLGLTYEISDRTLLGVVYRAEAEADLDGKAKFKNFLPLIPISPSANKIDIEWDNPQWLEVGLRYQLTDKDTLFINTGWQDWSAFSDNQLAFSGGALNPVVELDRNWDDTWYAGIAYAHSVDDKHHYTVGMSYDSSPVDDKDRTFDLPVDETWKFSAAYTWEGKKNLDFGIGATLYAVGDAEIDQTTQGVRVAGEFDNNMMLFISGTLRYQF